MNKLVLVLAASTAVSTSAAFYWRHQLIEERARNSVIAESKSPPAANLAAAQPAPGQSPRVTTQSLPGSSTATTVVETPKAAVASSPPPPAVEVPDSAWRLNPADKARMRQHMAEFLKKHEDSFGRNELRKQALERARLGQEGFDKARNLDPQTFEKLLGILADQELEMRVLQARCIVDPQCVVPPGVSELMTAQRQAIDDLLGAGGDAAVRDWRSTQAVRRMVKGFEQRLPVRAQMSGAQAQAFVAAVKAERTAAMQEWAANRQNITGYSNVDGLNVMYLRSDSLEESMSSAQSYVQRMKDRAATVLNGEQLLVYYQMQDELLYDLQRQLRTQERRKRERGS